MSSSRKITRRLTTLIEDLRHPRGLHLRSNTGASRCRYSGYRARRTWPPGFSIRAASGFRAAREGELATRSVSTRSADAANSCVGRRVRPRHAFENLEQTPAAAMITFGFEGAFTLEVDVIDQCVDAPGCAGHPVELHGAPRRACGPGSSASILGNGRIETVALNRACSVTVRAPTLRAELGLPGRRCDRAEIPRACSTDTLSRYAASLAKARPQPAR